MIRFKSILTLVVSFALIMPGLGNGTSFAQSNPAQSDKKNKAEPPAQDKTPKKKAPVFQVPPAPPKTRLSLPVVFHIGKSKLWKESESLKPVFAEMQRIFDQANIVLEPTFTTNGKATKHIDIVFLVKIGTGKRTPNGVSLGRRSRVLVRDNVGLRRLKDRRPTGAIPVPPSFPGAKSGETIKVNIEEAEQARTTAHEVGHQLRLIHRQELFNLMASGTTGWTFNQYEIDRMRKAAVEKFGAKTPEK